MLARGPAYPDDFWSVPGYLGADPTSSVHRDRVAHETVVAAEVPGPGSRATSDAAAGGVDESYQHAAAGSDATPVEITLKQPPSGWMLGAELHVRSGTDAGQVLRVASVDGARVILEPGQFPRLAAGDSVMLDNSSFLAAQTYHRHQVPGPEYPVWDQFRDDNGDPVHPQRPMILGPLFTASASGTVPTGDITEKMIVVACLLDREAFAWQADWYRQRVQEHVGANADDRFRLWYMDNATHGDDESQENQTHTVPYIGALHTALRQLAAWVECGIEPAPSTTYTVEDGQVSVPASAADRGGVQPTVTIRVNGSPATQVRVGEDVRILVEADSPERGLPFVAVATDFTGAGLLGDPIDVTPARQLSIAQNCAFDRPGTHFIAVRVTTQDEGNAGTAAGRVHNIARARITVTG